MVEVLKPWFAQLHSYVRRDNKIAEFYKGFISYASSQRDENWSEKLFYTATV